MVSNVMVWAVETFRCNMKIGGSGVGMYDWCKISLTILGPMAIYLGLSTLPTQRYTGSGLVDWSPFSKGAGPPGVSICSMRGSNSKYKSSTYRSIKSCLFHLCYNRSPCSSTSKPFSLFWFLLFSPMVSSIPFSYFVANERCISMVFFSQY
jgi:hypothetical protein